MAVVAVTIIGSASAQDGEVVGFDENVPLALSWNDLEKGVDVEVINNSSKPVALTFAVTALRGEGARRVGSRYLAIEVAEPVALPTRRRAVLELKPGKSEAVLIKRVGGATLPAGSYRSILVAYDKPGQPVARLALAIASTAAPSEPKPEPLAETLTITVYGNRFLLSWLDRRFHTSWFSRRYRAPDYAFLPLRTKAKGLSLPEMAEDRLLGGVQGSNGAVAVTYTGKPNAVESGRRALELRFEGLNRFGEYEGDLDTLPADKDAGKVTLKLVYSDFIWWPLLAVSIGVLTGFLISRVIGVSIPSRRLRDEVALLRNDYAVALETFSGRKKRPRGWRTANITKPVNEALKAVDDKIAEFGRTQVASIPPGDVEKLRTKIADVRTCINAFSALAGEMEDLEKKIVEIKTKRPRPLPDFHGGPTPHAAAELRKLLLAASSYDTFAEFKSYRDSVTKAITNASVWQKRESEISAAQADINTVKTPSDTLVGLARELLVFYGGLWNRIDVSVAAGEDYGDELHELRRKIDGAVLAVPKSERRPRVRTRPSGRSALEAAFDVIRQVPSTALPSDLGTRGPSSGGRGLGGILVLGLAIFAGLAGLVGAAWSAVGRALRWLVDADERMTEWIWARVDGFVDAHLGGWWTLGLLLLAFGIAVSTGLSTEYAGKAFGTSLWDYVKLFLWGVATKLILDGIVKSLDAIGVPRLLRR